ncbi:MAG: transposase family protein, partial [Planctomycetota bacterium]
ATSPVTQSERMFCDTQYKRLERGTFELLASANGKEGIELDYWQLVKLLGGLDLKTGRRRKRYRRVR